MNKGRKCQAVIGAVVLVALCLWAQTASAVVVRAPSGQFLGVTPHAGVAPASIPGSVAEHAGKPNVSQQDSRTISRRSPPPAKRSPTRTRTRAGTG